MDVKFTNNGHSTLAASASTSDTSITVASGHGARFPSLSGSAYFFATLIDASNNLEIVKCTARSSDVLTITRAQESTTARAFAIGDRIELRVTAAGLGAIYSEAVADATPGADTIVNSMIATDAVNADSIVADAVGASELNVSGNGSSGQALLSDGDGTFSWGTAGGVLQIKTGTYTGNATVGGTYTGGHLTVSITPKAANSSYLFIANCFFGYENHDLFADIGFDVSGSAPGGTITPTGASGGGDTCYHLSGIASSAGQSTVDDWAVATTPSHFFWTPSSNLGTGTRTFQVISRRRGQAGSIKWNERWGGGTDSRNARPVSTLTVLEISSGII